MRIVVYDSGPVLHLREAGVLDVLQHAGEVLIPPAVDQELARLIDAWVATRPTWLMRRALDPAAAPAPIQHLLTGLGAGETEAILLARQLNADWLLTDDAEARIIASLAGLEVHGSLGVLLWAAAQRPRSCRGRRRPHPSRPVLALDLPHHRQRRAYGVTQALIAKRHITKWRKARRGTTDAASLPTIPSSR